MILTFYKKVLQVLQEDKRLILMVVIANQGSSPGRKGFKMLVSKNQMFGTIGGGIMEHKLVEYAQNLLTKENFNPFIKHQIHDKSATKDQSGMICSGNQTIAFYDVYSKNKTIIDEIVNGKKSTIYFTNLGIQTNIQESENYSWMYKEITSLPNKAYIIGGGHVGLALSEVLSRLDFEIHILDHRENLNTMISNTFASFSKTVEFEKIEKHIPESENTYVIIMSFGYRTDDIIVRRLLNKKFKYIGMLGSKAKIKTLFTSLESDGFDKSQIAKVYAPIGIDIKSETAYEIAISIAAQLIKVKNQA